MNGSPPFRRTTFEPAPGALDEHGADFFLRDGVVGFLLADVDALGVGRGEVEQGGVGEVVEEDGVGVFEHAAAFDRDQLRDRRVRRR